MLENMERVSLDKFQAETNLEANYSRFLTYLTNSRSARATMPPPTPDLEINEMGPCNVD